MSLTVYKETQQLSEGVWVFERGHKEWCDEMNRNMEIINECIQRLNSHKTLTIKDEEGTILGTFNNQENKEIAVKQLFVDNWDLIKEVRYINGILTVTKLNGANIDIDLQIPTIPEQNTDVVTTATINGRTITFTKLNGDTFNVTVPDTVFPEIPEQNTNVVATASLNGNKITFTKLNGEMFDVTLPTTDISGLQPKLIAGDNITIESNVISAISSGGKDIETITNEDIDEVCV